jgi:hypothetical protein
MSRQPTGDIRTGQWARTVDLAMFNQWQRADTTMTTYADQTRLRADSGAFDDAGVDGGATARPREVPGPGGVPITLETLPPPNTVRWVVRRKAEVLAAIRGGLLTAAEACARYRLSPEELELWQSAIDRAGVPGLRVTRIQLYRDQDRRRPTPEHAVGLDTRL